jgi:hypothetical protein
VRRLPKKITFKVPKGLLAKKNLGLGLAAIALLVAATILVWPHPTKSENQANAPLVDTCAKNSVITYSCYKNLLTGIVEQQGPEKAFTLVKQQYGTVSYVKSQCHQLGHVIGRAAYAKYGNIADTFAHGDQYCWSGYYHGVMEQLTDEKGYDYTIKNANTICAPIAAKQRYSFYHYNCVHGLGHGFMEVLKGDLFASLTACDAITDSWERESCYGGSFMQNIMNVQSPDETVDHTSKYLRPSEPMYPCTAVDLKYKQQCYLMQTSYALQTVQYDFNKVFAMCSQVQPQSMQDTCYQSLGRDASGNTVSDVNRTKAICESAPSFNAERNCIHGASVDFVSYFHSDVQANQLCNSLENTELKNDCLNTVKNYYASF